MPGRSDALQRAELLISRARDHGLQCMAGAQTMASASPRFTRSIARLIDVESFSADRIDGEVFAHLDDQVVWTTSTRGRRSQCS